MSNGSPRPASRGVAASQGVRWAVQKPRSSLIFCCERMRDERATPNQGTERTNNGKYAGVFTPGPADSAGHAMPAATSAPVHKHSTHSSDHVGGRQCELYGGLTWPRRCRLALVECRFQEKALLRSHLQASGAPQTVGLTLAFSRGSSPSAAAPC